MAEQIKKFQKALNLNVGEGRKGITYDQWPFRLDIDVEYQDWLLIVACCVMIACCLIPCICGRMRNWVSKKFSSWVYTRLHIFFCTITYINLMILMTTITVLPDWTLNTFFQHLIKFFMWFLEYMEHVITSAMILIGFYLLYKFFDRISYATGLEHVTFFRWSWREFIGLGVKRRPIELFVWKITDLRSATSKVMKANDIFLECMFGANEPMRTRVHNNAGTGCQIKESFQLNLDQGALNTTMTLLVKDQTMVASTELARVKVSTRELLCIEDQTGKRHSEFMYDEEYFVRLSLMPQGNIWIALSPVEDGNEENRPLMTDGDELLVTC